MTVKIGHASLQELSKEEGFEYKEITSHPGYFATTDGRIWGKRKNGFLSPSIVKGYYRVSLSKNGKVTNYLVHRLVGLTFIPNPDNKPTINHRDENPKNNCIDNLEWATFAENTNYGTRSIRQVEAQLNRKDCSRPVAQMDKAGNTLAVFPSSKDAWRQTNVRHNHIRAVCNGQPKHKTAGGFMWRWADQTEVAAL